MLKINEAMEYIKTVTEKKDAISYLSQFNLEDQLDILITAKALIADTKIRCGTNMSGKCYECKYRGDVPGDAHSCCMNPLAYVVGDEYGIENGWFLYPFNFDAVWLKYCDGFEKEMENNDENKN